MTKRKRVYRVVDAICETCGATFKRTTERRKPRCFNCNMGRLRDEITEMIDHSGPRYERSAAAGRDFAKQYHARSGPAYERWRYAQLMAADRLRATTGDTP